MKKFWSWILIAGLLLSYVSFTGGPVFGQGVETFNNDNIKYSEVRTEEEFRELLKDSNRNRDLNIKIMEDIEIKEDKELDLGQNQKKRTINIVGNVGDRKPVIKLTSRKNRLRIQNNMRNDDFHVLLKDLTFKTDSLTDHILYIVGGKTGYGLVDLTLDNIDFTTEDYSTSRMISLGGKNILRIKNSVNFDGRRPAIAAEPTGSSTVVQDLNMFIEDNGKLKFKGNERQGSIYGFRNLNIDQGSNSELVFEGNKGQREGGAISGQNISIDQKSGSSIKFIDNNGPKGGAIYATNSLDIKGGDRSSLVFEGNLSNLDGGAIYLDKEVSKFALPKSSYFKNNSANKSGGAIYMSSLGKDTDLKIGYQFIGNRAGEHGGAIYIDQLSEVSINNNVFKGNQAMHGGAIGFNLEKKTISRDNLVDMREEYRKLRLFDYANQNLNVFEGNISARSVDTSQYDDENHILHSFMVLLEHIGYNPEIVKTYFNNDDVKLRTPIDVDEAIKLTKTPDKNKVKVGENIEYKIVNKNISESFKLMRINIEDRLDKGLENIKVEARILKEDGSIKAELEDKDIDLKDHLLNVKATLLEPKESLLINISAKVGKELLEGASKLDNSVKFKGRALDQTLAIGNSIEKEVAAETVEVQKKSVDPVKPIDPDTGEPIVVKKFRFVFDGNKGLVEGKETIVDFVDDGKKVEARDKVSRDGYYFLGWSTDKDSLKVFDFHSPIKKDTRVYAIWSKDTLKHMAYLEGYKDQTIRPEANLTRAETAAIIYRVMDKDIRDQIYSGDYIYKDKFYQWSKKYISTLSNGKVLVGYPDRSFRPNNKITRAEVVTILYRFEELSKMNKPILKDQVKKLKDIKGHWAEEYISLGVEKGLIKGYENGKFKPDAYITRAEFVTLVNRLLDRSVNRENVLEENLEKFGDLDAKKWYYLDIVEASNGHIHQRERLEDGSELWLEVIDFFGEM